jgi:HSP20 family protein
MTKTLVTFDPVRELRNMQQVFERLFEAPVREAGRGLTFPIDVFEKEGALVIRAAAPGVEPSGLDVQIEEDVLTIRGEAKSDVDLSDAKVYRREVSYGTFTRSVRLPEGLNLDQVDATFANGVVTITIPRVEPAQPATRKIEVRPAGAPSAE